MRCVFAHTNEFDDSDSVKTIDAGLASVIKLFCFLGPFVEKNLGYLKFV